MFHHGNQSRDNEYYDTLGLTREATINEIKKAYRNLARKYHPDKVNDDKLKPEYTKRFQKIGEAYETLSDPETRKLYDQFGKEGAKTGGNAGMNPFNVFNSFFNNGFSFNGRTNARTNARGQPQKHKSSPVVHQVNVSLEDLYNGRIIKLKITKKTIYNMSNNSPCPRDQLESTWDPCQTCKGNGMVMEMRQLGPGFVSQTQRPCQTCNRTGYCLKSGYQLRDHEDIVEVEVKPGMNPKTEHIITGGGNCYPGTIPGDVIIAFLVVSHSIYQLSGNNLTMNKTILLSDSLCGFSFDLMQLDGTWIKIKSTDIINPGMVKNIPNLGMKKSGYTERGNLIITFDVEFPSSLLIHQRQNIKKYLPKDNLEPSGPSRQGGTNTIMMDTIEI